MEIKQPGKKNVIHSPLDDSVTICHWRCIFTKLKRLLWNAISAKYTAHRKNCFFGETPGVMYDMEALPACIYLLDTD